MAPRAESLDTFTTFLEASRSKRGADVPTLVGAVPALLLIKASSGVDVETLRAALKMSIVQVGSLLANLRDAGLLEIESSGQTDRARLTNLGEEVVAGL